jgi:hypothetical protein
MVFSGIIATKRFEIIYDHCAQPYSTPFGLGQNFGELRFRGWMEKNSGPFCKGSVLISGLRSVFMAVFKTCEGRRVCFKTRHYYFAATA